MEHDDYILRVNAQRIFCGNNEADKREAMIKMYVTNNQMWHEREKAQEAKLVMRERVMLGSILALVAVVAFAIGTVVQKVWC